MNGFEWKAEIERRDEIIASYIGLTDGLRDLERRNRLMRMALTRIERWKMPPSGRTWNDGSKMSYAAAFGSNGERDVIRAIARKALADTTP